MRWQNGVRRFSRAEIADKASDVEPRYIRFKQLWQHDIQAQVNATDAFSFYVGVNNFANQKPDNGFETISRSLRSVATSMPEPRCGSPRDKHHKKTSRAHQEGWCAGDCHGVIH